MVKGAALCEVRAVILDLLPNTEELAPQDYTSPPPLFLFLLLLLNLFFYTFHTTVSRDSVAGPNVRVWYIADLVKLPKEGRTSANVIVGPATLSQDTVV